MSDADVKNVREPIPRDKANDYTRQIAETAPGLRA